LEETVAVDPVEVVEVEEDLVGEVEVVAAVDPVLVKEDLVGKVNMISFITQQMYWKNYS
jgi:hypothetical protein